MNTRFLLISLFLIQTLASQDLYQAKFGFGANSGWIKLVQFDLENGATHNSVIIDAKINYIRTSQEGYSARTRIFLRKGVSYDGKWNYSINGTEIGDLVKFKKIDDNIYELYTQSLANYGHVTIEMSVTKENSFAVNIPTTITFVSNPDIFQDVPKAGDLALLMGNVGIGTNQPDSKLTVKGNIHAEEVRVDLQVPGPDYVFKEGYDLRSLQEVQNYIKAHGHLPNIPSAKEMEEHGVQLGKMNMKLLEKIEELTLYIIEQDKIIKNQQLRLNRLEEQNFKKNREKKPRD